jgi:hypothetical protein
MKRPQFSLRTLFIAMTVCGSVAGWFVYQLNWIRQRHKFLDSPELHLKGVVQLAHDEDDPTFRYPWTLKLFGETPIVWLLGVEPDYVEQAKSLFPEATINPDIDMSKL